MDTKKLENLVEELALHQAHDEEERQRHIEKVLEENTRAIADLTRSTQELVEAWNNAKGFIKVVSAISRFVKIVAPIGLLISAVLYFFKTGVWPKG